MKHSDALGIVPLLALVVLASGCQTRLFPADVMKGVQRQESFDFQGWRARSLMPSSNRETSQKVELGGQILDVEPWPGGELIVADQLPIVEHPKYGPAVPKEGMSKRGASSFAVSFTKPLHKTWLQPGNRFIVVGRTQGSRTVTVDGVLQQEPYLVAQCIHLWKNQGNPIASYPFETGAGYYPL
ncbi:MAG TPA: Slp family lipoprotein, partial [Nitrospira sp.]|nr:Slp family lipoprotein [Nitrospira sp.]